MRRGDAEDVAGEWARSLRALDTQIIPRMDLVKPRPRGSSGEWRGSGGRWSSTAAPGQPPWSQTGI
jgi:hypothetical protein